ncbi:MULTISPECIES: FMN-dependent NADH-azoreductase [Burkholderia cepacia complex]|uniref:FMN-dependent NADH-azoreductase n=1 Tax=Burkholderia cepacia complex TaxID=87882 RepID=UPI00064C3479|nr:MULTISPECIES: NAD(P)H-dependent oxidoreductase [Burkholderia cepacia complex]AKM02466.1 FMN-dependent NADH-azoreductase [Burkholderia pyrrocinia]GAU05525.1 flavodoxin-like protein [Burkholderia stabilis]
MNLLHIDSSILGDHSVSRNLSADIVDRLSVLHPRIRVTYRDLEKDPALHLSSTHVSASQGNANSDEALAKDIALGAQYLDDLFPADFIVIGSPMYNFSISSQLKAWIDRIVVAGKTFRYGPNGPESLLPEGKKVFIASSRGGQYTGNSPSRVLDHQESYLTGILSFIGLTDVTIVRAEGLALGDEARNAAIAKAKREISEFVF